VYKGVDAIQLSHLVTRPAHSIINQAFDARLRLDATRSVNVSRPPWVPQPPASC
jgi:glutamine amidotransferase